MKDLRSSGPKAGFTVKSRKAVSSVLHGVRVHVAAHLGFDGFYYSVKPSATRQAECAGSNLDATIDPCGSRSHMLLSFQRPSRPGAGTPPVKRPLHMRKASVEAPRCAPLAAES